MRTRWLVVRAALAAAFLTLTGCEGDKITTVVENININRPSGPVVSSVSDTVGACVINYDVHATGPLTIPVGGEVTLTVFRDPSDPNCPVEQNFQFEAAKGGSIVLVTTVNSSNGRVRGMAPGVDTVWAVSIPGRAIRIPVQITVTGTSTSLAINSIPNISSGNGCVRTFQGVLNIPGTAGTWSVSGINGATVNGTTGAGTVPQGSSGTLVLTFTPSTGGAVSTNVTVVTTDCTSNTCTVTSFNPTTPSASLTVGGTQQITPNLTTNPAGCGTVSYVSNTPNVVTVNANGLVTGVSAGVGTVTVTPVLNGVNGNPVTLSFNVSAQTVTVNPNVISVTNCTGFQSAWNPTVSVGGSATTGTWSSSNTAVATVNSTTGAITLTGTPGTSTVTVQTSSGSAPITVTVNQCQTGSVTVDVQPATFSLIVGQQPITLTATVTAPAGQSTAVTWSSNFVGTSTSAANCVSVTPNGNTATVQAIAGCTQQIEVRATSVANTSVFDTSVGTTSSGNVTCTITWNGTTTGNITVGVNQNQTVTGSCTNQFGAQFIPYWYVGAPPVGGGPHIVTVQGATTSINIAGQNWPAGPQATLRGMSAGQSTIYMQAAVTDMTVLASRLVIVQ